jgi:hypothetical protein
MQLVPFLETVFNNPPIPYEPAKHSLKAWAKYCLQTSGLKIVYAQNADFAIEIKDDKYFIKVSDRPPEEEHSKFIWLVFNTRDRGVQVILPAS